MRAEAQTYIDQIDAAMALVRRFLVWDRALGRLHELDARAEDPTLWNDPKAAQKLMQERRRLDESVAAVRVIEQERDDTAELIELADAEGDTALGDEGLAALRELAARAEQDKVRALLAGEADANNSYVEINAGAGGTESQDWAEMLQRMYHALGRAPWHEGRADRISCRRAGRDQVRYPAAQGRERLWLVEDREWRASPRAHLAL